MAILVGLAIKGQLPQKTCGDEGNNKRAIAL